MKVINFISTMLFLFVLNDNFYSMQEAKEEKLELTSMPIELIEYIVLNSIMLNENNDLNSVLKSLYNIMLVNKDFKDLILKDDSNFIINHAIKNCIRKIKNKKDKVDILNQLTSIGVKIQKLISKERYIDEILLKKIISALKLSRVDFFENLFETGDKDRETNKHIKICFLENCLKEGLYKLFETIIELEDDLYNEDYYNDNIFDFIINNCQNEEKAEEKALELIEKLLNLGFDINYKDSHGESMLYKSCYSSKEKLFEFLIEKGADLNIQDKEGVTPLMLAVESSSKSIIKKLLEKGARLDIHDNEGSNVFHYIKDVESLDLLAQYKEDNSLLNKTNIKNEFPLALNMLKKDIFLKLLQYSADPDSQLEINGEKNYLIFLILEGYDLLPQENNLFPLKDPKLLKMLLDYKANPNVKDRNGRTPLMKCVSLSNVDKAIKEELINLLLEYGADPKINSFDGYNCLDFANDHYSVNIIINFDKNITEKQKNLIRAMKYGNIVELLNLIDDKDIDLNTQNSSGETVLMWSIKNNHGMLFNKLVENQHRLNLNITDGNGHTALRKAVKYNNIAIIRKLLDLGSDPSILDNNGFSCLDESIYLNNLDIFYLLISLNKIDLDQTNPLIYAIAQSKVEAFNCLLENGCDINNNIENKINPFHMTPFLFSIYTNKLNFINLILKSPNLDINKTDKFKNTSLIYSIYNNSINLFSELIDRKADLNIKNHRFFSAIDIAAKKNINLMLLKLLSQDDLIINSDFYIYFIFNNNLNMLKKSYELMLNKNINFNIIKALYLSVKVNNKDIFDWLLSIAKDQDKEKFLIYTILSTEYNPEKKSAIIKILIDFNVKVNININNNIPLIKAVENNLIDVVELLLKAGANKDIQDIKGNTALIKAVKLGYNDIAKNLILYQADPNIKNNKSKTVYDKVEKLNEETLISRLLKRRKFE